MSLSAAFVLVDDTRIDVVTNTRRDGAPIAVVRLDGYDLTIQADGSGLVVMERLADALDAAVEKARAAERPAGAVA